MKIQKLYERIEKMKEFLYISAIHLKYKQVTSLNYMRKDYHYGYEVWIFEDGSTLGVPIIAFKIYEGKDNHYLKYSINYLVLEEMKPLEYSEFKDKLQNHLLVVPSGWNRIEEKLKIIN
jgi:hypothetical protein